MGLLTRILLNFGRVGPGRVGPTIDKQLFMSYSCSGLFERSLSIVGPTLPLSIVGPTLPRPFQENVNTRSYSCNQTFQSWISLHPKMCVDSAHYRKSKEAQRAKVDLRVCQKCYQEKENPQTAESSCKVTIELGCFHDRSFCANDRDEVRRAAWM